MGASKSKGLHKTAKITQGNLCRREIDPSFNQLHILGTVNFKDYYINNVNAETTGWIIPWETNSPPAEVSTQ